MRSLFNFMVSTDNRYNNKIDVDGKELIVNTEITERDYMYVNRIGTVTQIPIIGDYPIQVGDDVIVHHNVFRRWYDQYGNGKNGKSFLSEDLYTVENDQVFAYRRNGEWYATPGYCFVAPVEFKDEWNMETEKKLQGILKIGPSELLGHTVGFTPNSEYEFNIDNQKLYRVLSNQITVDYGCESKKKTNHRVKS